MAAILETWNPNKWPWDDIDEMVAETASGNAVRSRWSVSNRRHGIAIGDRFFLLKQEVEPRGIVASGTISSLPFEDAHWNNKPGATTKRLIQKSS